MSGSAAGNYFTHFNGGRPFYVEIESNNEVKIYDDFKEKEKVDPVKGGVVGNILLEKKEPFMTCKPLKIWVGRCPQYDSEFGHGNTILLQLTPDNYLAIVHETVFTFKPSSRIVEYHSPIGNNDVVYPFAKTEDGETLLLGEGEEVIVLSKKHLSEKEISQLCNYKKDDIVTTIKTELVKQKKWS